MITLNDYLYDGDTIFRILQKYIDDLKKSAKENKNEINRIHSHFLIQIRELLEHNDFLTAQSQKIREFYKYMAKEYPYLAFTFKGRIKSLIRAEEKFNSYVMEYIYEYYSEHQVYPSVSELKKKLSCFRDLIAYRIVISMPKCHFKSEQERRDAELNCLYEIANVLPEFLEERGFTAEPANGVQESCSSLLNPEVKPYYRDYVSNHEENEYQSLHITFYDNSSRSYMEVQLRTKRMDDVAEIGAANHRVYEKKQEKERRKRNQIPKGECLYFDEAYERGMRLLELDLSKLDAYERCRRLQELELSGVDVDMFTAVSNSLMNDGCGLYRGRLILPYEHLSRFQNDLID